MESDLPSNYDAHIHVDRNGEWQIRVSYCYRGVEHQEKMTLRQFCDKFHPSVWLRT